MSSLVNGHDYEYQSDRRVYACKNTDCCSTVMEPGSWPAHELPCNRTPAQDDKLITVRAGNLRDVLEWTLEALAFCEARDLLEEGGIGPSTRYLINRIKETYGQEPG